MVILFFIWFGWELFSLATLPTGENARGLIFQCAFILSLIAVYCADQRFLLPRRARLTWRRLENANLILLYQSANEFVIVPKCAFAAPLPANLQQALVPAERKELLF